MYAMRLSTLTKADQDELIRLHAAWEAEITKLRAAENEINAVYGDGLRKIHGDGPTGRVMDMIRSLEYGRSRALLSASWSLSHMGRILRGDIYTRQKVTRKR